MTVRLAAGAGARIAALHAEAGTTIHSSGATAPAGVDGGIATPQLAEIISAVSETADSLAKIHGVLGKQVLAASGNITRTDDEVAREFRTLNKELE